MTHQNLDQTLARLTERQIAGLHFSSIAPPPGAPPAPKAGDTR